MDGCIYLQRLLKCSLNVPHIFRPFYIAMAILHLLGKCFCVSLYWLKETITILTIYWLAHYLPKHTISASTTGTHCTTHSAHKPSQQRHLYSLTIHKGTSTILFTLAHIAPHFSISLAVISNEGTLQIMILSIHCFGASRILSDKIWLSH